MDVGVILIVMGTLMVLALLRMPIAFALITSATIGLLLLDGTRLTVQAITTIPYEAVASYFLVLIPLYILMGVAVSEAGLTDQLYKVAAHVLRRVPGALGVATIAACAGFAAVTGSSVATAATLGRVSVRVMQQHGYPASFAAGIVAAAGTLGVLIPPSIVLVIYGVIAGESIGALLIAGFIPGALSALAYAAYVIWKERSFDKSALEARSEPIDVSEEIVAYAREEAEAGKRVIVDEGERIPYNSLIYIAVLFGIIVSGIYAGFFTVIEAGAIAALVALVGMAGKVAARRGSVAKLFSRSFSETVSITSMIFLLLIGGALFTYFLVRSGATREFVGWVVGLDVPPYVILFLILLALIPLGMVLDSLSVIVIVGPIVHPIIVGLGFEGVWFAILFVRMVEIALVTPPVGLNVFVVSGASGVSVSEVFRGVWAFVGVDILVVATLIAFPQLVLFLPEAIR